MRDDRGQDQDVITRSCKEWLDSGYISQAEVTGFVMEQERQSDREKSKTLPKFLT